MGSFDNLGSTVGRRTLPGTLPFLMALAVLVLLVGLWLVAMPETGPHIGAEQFRARLDQLSGPGAKRCQDELLARGNVRPLNPCLGNAIQSGAPFQAAIMLPGPEGEHWVGYARDPGGATWRVTLDPQHSDGSDGRSEMVGMLLSRRCPGLRLQDPSRVMDLCAVDRD